MTTDMPAMDEKGQALKDIEACLDEAVSYLVDLAGAKPDKHSPNNCRVKIDEARFYARHLASLKAVPEVEVVAWQRFNETIGRWLDTQAEDVARYRKLGVEARALVVATPQPSPDTDGDAA